MESSISKKIPFSSLVRDTFRSIRHRNYRLFFFGQLISLVGTWLENTAQTWLVYTLTTDARVLGFISFIGSIPVVFLSILAGTVADEYPKRRLLIYTQSMMAVLSFALFFIVWQGHVTVWMVAIISLLAGCAVAFDTPVRQAFVVEMVGKEDLTNAVALNSAVFNSARLVGPALGAFIIALFSMATCFLLNSLSFIAVIIGLSMMRFSRTTEHPRPAKTSRLSAMKEGLRYLYMIKQFRALMVMVIAMTIFGWSYSVNLPIVAAEILHGNSTTYGWLLSSNGVGALLAALTQAAGAGKLPPRKMLFIGVGVFIISTLTLAFVPFTIAAMLCLVGTGWGIITFFITANTTIQRQVPDQLRGRVMGIYSLAFGLFPFGSLLTGCLTHAFGVEASFIINSSCVLITAIPVYLYVRKLPHLPYNGNTLQETLQAEQFIGNAEQIAKS